MKKILCDFHVHSILSPCAEIEMTPHHIMLRASEAGIGAVAITDHNASGNIQAALDLAAKYEVAVLPGMEVETIEEAHIVVLFDTLEQMTSWQEYIDANREPRLNNAERFGAQFVVDAEDNLIREEEKMLLGAGKLTAEEVIAACHKLGGICWAAHIDRPAYSLLKQLGFLGEDLALDAVEISRNALPELQTQSLKPLVHNLPYLTNSDGHTMHDFLTGPKNQIKVEAVTVQEIKKALQGVDGRIIKPGQFATLLDDY